MNKKMTNWLTRILMSDIVDSFYGHRGRPGYRGGSVPKTEHTTKHRNSQFESEAGEEGFSIAHAMKMSKPHKYTAKEHKAMQDRALVLVSGDQIAGSKYGGMQLYRYNKKDKCLECSYGDNPTLYLKDLKGKEVRTFQPTSDVVNKDTIHAVRKKRIAKAKKEDLATKINRLDKCAPTPDANELVWIEDYSGNGSTVMNFTLRDAANVNRNNGEVEKHKIDNDVLEAIETLDGYLGKSKLDQDTMLYRICNGDGVMGVFENEMKRRNLKMDENDHASIQKCLKKLIGTIGQEQGFMSTSADKKFVETGGTGPTLFKYEIFAPRGTQAACIRQHSNYRNEDEVLAQRGTKMLLTGFRKVKNDYVLQVQIVN